MSDPSPIRATIGRVVRAGLEALFPADCLLCLQPLPWRQRGGVCLPCWERIAWTPGVSLGHRHLRAIMWAGDYDGPVRHLIRQLKFGGIDYLGRHLGEELARRLGPLLGAGPIARPDWIVPVPLHWRRRMRRGYNQASLIAAGFAGPCRLPLLPAALARLGGGRQLGSGRAERLRGLRHRFSGRRRPWRYGQVVSLEASTILLLDDVVTTGATFEACAAALRAAGSGPVIGCAVARTAARHGRQGAPPGVTR